jgi:uncharacterized membrane protein YfcA
VQQVEYRVPSLSIDSSNLTNLVHSLSSAIFTDPWFYLTAIPAILIVGIAKGGLGGGIGIVGVPLMALTISPLRAAAIMLPILILMDMHALWNFKKRGDWQNLKILLPAAILGIVLGAFTFRYLSAAHIRILIGTLAIGFVFHTWIKGIQAPPKTLNRISGYFWGAVAGFTSFGVHAGGPPVNIYLLPQKLDKTTFQATTVIFFTIVNLVKLVPYAWLGQFNTSNLLMALVLAPLAPIGISMGYYLHQRINEKLFFNVVYLSLAIVGVKLIFDGWQAQL